MKRLITLDELAICFCSSVAYGLGFLIPNRLNFHIVLSVGICLIAGFLVEEIAQKILFCRYIQSKSRRSVLTWITYVAIFLAGSAVAMNYLGRDLEYELEGQIGYIFLSNVISFAFSMIVFRVKQYFLRKKYGDGSKGYILTKSDHTFMARLNGKNKVIIGEYDKEQAVKTKTGVYVGKTKKNIVSYLGIPYAVPPVGQLRWKAPIPLKPSDEVFEAFYYGHSEIQPENKANLLNFHQQSEDCLTLNIWKSKKIDKNIKRPVLVYLHEGDFMSGGSANPIGEGAAFVHNHSETIFVSINYRFGIFGFIDFAEVDGGADYPDATNCGLLDQIEALRWIKDNISAFGGDPDNITLFGTGSGGTCALLLSLIEAAQQLFRKIIVFSISDEYICNDRVAAIELGKALAEEFNVKSMNELALIPAEDIRKVMPKFWHKGGVPSCSSALLPPNIYTLFKDGTVRNDLEVIIGVPQNELSNVMAFEGESRIRELQAIRLEEFDSFYTPEQQQEILKSFNIDTPVGRLQNEELLKVINELMFICTPLCLAQFLAEKEGKVHCFLWDVTPNIEKMRANATSFLTTVFGNFSVGERLGYINDKNLKVVTQLLIFKFLSDKNLNLYHNEIHGIDALNWPRYTKSNQSVLRFNQKSIKIEAHFFEDKTSVLNKMLDLLF